MDKPAADPEAHKPIPAPRKRRFYVVKWPLPKPRKRRLVETTASDIDIDSNIEELLAKMSKWRQKQSQELLLHHPQNSSGMIKRHSASREGLENAGAAGAPHRA